MTKHSGSKHLKRLNAPKTYPIPRKAATFTVRPHPGPHPAERSIPISVVLREVLAYAKNLSEAKTLLRKRKIMVDQRVITDYKFPIGLMDVISIKTIHEHYRVLPFQGKMVLHEIPKEESDSKILAITGKKIVKGGKIQLNLEDGRNILIEPEDREKRREILETYHRLDALQISLPNQEILNHFKLEKGSYCLIVDGEHMGRNGKIKDIKEKYGPKGASTITIETEGEEITSAIDYALIIGEENPVYSLPSQFQEVKLRSEPLKLE